MRIESIEELLKTEIKGFLVHEIITLPRFKKDGFSILENDFLYERNKNILVNEDGSMTLTNLAGIEVAIFPLYGGRSLHHRVTLEQIAGRRGGLLLTDRSLAELALDGPPNKKRYEMIGSIIVPIKTREEKIEDIAQYLFQLLDDIDTVDDMAKSDGQAYRIYVQDIQRKRFNVATTDGYKVTWKF